MAHVPMDSLPPLRVKLQGTCRSCMKGIPQGYIPVVTSWSTVNWGNGFAIHKPDGMYCRECGSAIEGEPRYRRPRIHKEEPKLEPKEIMIKIYGVMDKATPHSSKWLAGKAGINYEDYRESILEILKRLRAASKVKFEEGKWLKV